ncbi:site-specific integrase [Lysinibacillus capsici]|uniref:site-specific integrase n=1 Tax=Lysinibacillus capsici TaxID=2115968 RepID=UPI0032E3ED35
MAKRNTTTIELYKLKDGQKRYRFKVYVGVDPLTGKEKRTTRSGFKTKKEAELELARIKLEIEKGTFRKERAETYQEVYDLWVKHYENTVEESTFVKTTGIFKNHILPAMGNYKIEKINIDVCQRHVDEWAKKLKKFRTVKAYAAKVLDFAIKRGYLQTNPFSHVDMPLAAKKKSILADEEESENFYTREQLVDFLACLEKEDNYKAFALFRLLAFSGMRKGEALALTWNDVDFKTNEIRINKAISRGKNNQLYVKSTKTGVSRIIKMDEKTMSILNEWRKKQKKEYLTLGFNTTKSKQLVFSNEQNEFLQPTKTRKWILHVQKKYNLSTITTHGLRHTHCSLLFEAGASLKEVQDRLGHSDIQTTMNIYTHVTKKAKEEAIMKFADFMSI